MPGPPAKSPSDTPPDASVPSGLAAPTVASQVPLDLVIELVESRLHRRRQLARRWLLGTIATSLGLTLTALGLLYTVNSDYTRFRTQVELREALEKTKPHSPAETFTQQDDSDESLFLDSDFLAFPGFEKSEGGTRNGRLEQRSDQSISVALEGGRATAFLAKCDGNCLDLDLLLFDARRELVVEDSLPDTIPFVEYTPDESGEFILQVKMFRCSAADCKWELNRLDARRDA